MYIHIFIEVNIISMAKKSIKFPWRIDNIDKQHDFGSPSALFVLYFGKPHEASTEYKTSSVSLDA